MDSELDKEYSAALKPWQVAENRRVEEAEKRLGRKITGPTCEECGAPMNHYRLYGYQCSANMEHRGILWPKYDEPA